MSLDHSAFDERQLEIRGDVFRHGFGLIVVLMLVSSYLIDVGFVWAEGMWPGMLITLAAISVCSIEMILRGVYHANSKSQMITWMLGVLSIGLLGYSIFELATGTSLIVDSHLTKSGVYLAMELMFVATFAAFLYARASAKRDTDDD
jgi:hypothetical protein